jgi:hypothetical protein
MPEDAFARFRRLRGIVQPAVVSVFSLPPREEKQNYRELLPEALVELWEERGAIMEYEGRLSREEAEWQAFLCVQSLDEARKDLR